MKIKNGDVAQGSRWSEPVVVNLVEEIGDYIRVVGVTRNSRQHIDQLIHQDEISALDSGKIESNFTAEPGQVFLGLETRRETFYYLLVTRGLSYVSTTDRIESYRSEKSFTSLICEISVNLWLKVLFATA
ncbi:MAG: hypothetical protein EF813_01625 [Methanosarcinales archaeon]|nr:MAG: hypothetical protein EF813_01625 [Methanosarcinales archaeon]